ncbi:MAG: phosphoethanolamine transferase CptA [Candidatus Azobacteroides sp.]|nr:phosphoethanolamine transferase CptA [Candidatus Azobacteroides sp.]
MKINHELKRRSNYQRKMIILLWVFGILSLIIVPAFTIYLGAHGNPLKFSLSAIGNRPEMRPVFLAWTIAMCAYFSGIVFAIIVLTKNSRARTFRILILVSTWLLLITNLIPFLPEKLPVLANIHTNAAVISTVLLAFTLLMLTYTFQNYYPKLFLKSHIAILCLLAVMIILFIFFEAKWITEGTCIIGGSIFLFSVMYWLYKENNFDAEDVLSSYDLDLARREVQRLENRTKEVYEEYLKLNTQLRMAQVELQEMKKFSSN